MSESKYRNRRVHILSNDHLEIAVTVEGGHIASVLDRTSGVNPLWAPPWPSIEPSQYAPKTHPESGSDSESKLLSGILGHNVCIDLFGGPSETEAAAGMTVHGEASVAPYEINLARERLTQCATLQQAQLRFRREIHLPPAKRIARITETIENLSALDRPIAWTQHATLGPPFLEKGLTQFRITATKGKVIEHDFTGGKGHLVTGAEFLWPSAPCKDGKTEDLSFFSKRAISGAYTTQLMDPSRDDAFFIAWSPTHRLAFGYVWNRRDFPWLGIWEENYSRAQPPWNGKTLTRGMEFGVSPFPETRRAMIERGNLFGFPGFRWVPARQTCTAEYNLFLIPAESLPESPPTV
jgi:hypothetical protein